MRGSVFPRRIPDDNPIVNSWLNALREARLRTKAALRGINPWDAIVPLVREKHNLLIGEATAEHIQMQLGRGDPEPARMTTITGRNLITGLPAKIEISASEIRGADNTEATQPYVDWSFEEGYQTIGNLLYAIAANEANWLYTGILQQSPPDEVEGLFHRDPKDLELVRGETMAQHWKRLNMVRSNLFDAYREMTLEDFQRTRMGSGIYCSAEWVAHELCQFEAEHRSDIAFMLAGARKALNPPTND